jgi:hypothetical protein
LSVYTIASKDSDWGYMNLIIRLTKGSSVLRRRIADDGNVSVKVTLEKQSSLMVLRFSVTEQLKFSATDASNFMTSRKSENEIIVKFGEEVLMR